MNRILQSIYIVFVAVASFISFTQVCWHIIELWRLSYTPQASEAKSHPHFTAS